MTAGGASFAPRRWSLPAVATEDCSENSANGESPFVYNQTYDKQGNIDCKYNETNGNRNNHIHDIDNTGDTAGGDLCAVNKRKESEGV